ARQSLYRYQEPRLHLPMQVLDRAGLDGTETVADIGCGNGAYLAELARRGHAGPVLVIDLSAGMLRAARARAPGAALAARDAAALHLRDASVGAAIAAHMLYHVPGPAAAVRELRRVTRPGGRVLVVLNGLDHLRELRDLMAACGAEAAMSPHRDLLHLDTGAALLASAFASLERHDFVSALPLPGP